MRDLTALTAFIEGRAAMPFAWGRSRNDCISYGLGAVKAQTGKDVLAKSGLRWSSAKSAAKALHSVGGLRQALDDRLPRIAASMARRGDIGVADGEAGRELLVVIEGDALVGPGPHGNERLPRSALKAAWSIAEVAGEA